MSDNYYSNIYKKIDKTLCNLTPLKADCGQLCGAACCKGDNDIGMRLFPHEQTTLDTINTESGITLVVCDGQCDRERRPLACKIFPFFPTIDEKGSIYAELDYRGKRLCPMIDHCEEIIFDKKFLKAIKKIGKIFKKDDECRKFLIESTEEIDTYREFYGI